MATGNLLAPSRGRLQRALGAALRILREEESEARFTRLQKSLGVSLEELPVVRRWAAAKELLRYPPAYIGKANLPKMAEEHRILREISKTLATNALDPLRLLNHPDCERLFQFVERRRPSLLGKWEQRRVLEALPFYLAGRLQESIDAVLVCLVRKARLLRNRVHEEAEETRREESIALLERSGPRLKAMRVAFAEALASGSPEPLKPFQRTLDNLERAGSQALDRERLYRLIESRGSYTRKLAHRLVGVGFEGFDDHARAVVGVLPEVLRFAPFEKRVPREVTTALSFLGIPPHLLEQRSVFEPMVLVTLADHLWSGRVTVPLSRRFGSLWRTVPREDVAVAAREWVAERRTRLDRAWREFEVEARKRPLVKDGRLLVRRPKSLLTRRQERVLRERHEKLLRRLRSVPVLEALLQVHRATGMLDELRLPAKAPHQLPEDERIRLAAGVVAAMGMNVSLRDMVTVLGRGYRITRIQHFVERYVTKENLERALGRLLASWDARRLGVRWGPGTMVSVDGKVVGAFENNLLSRYHYRRGRSGMTVYWFRRDDGIATRVRPLGNQEWEAWHVLDELLHTLTGRGLRASCGDTQGQFLALWGLAELVGKDILARFRRTSRVLLYKPTGRNRAGIRQLRVIRWDVIERALPSMLELAEAIRSGRVRAVDAFRRLHLYDGRGRDVAAALRELGKAARTEFILRYALDENLRRRIQAGCNDAENWNSFHEAIFWGNGGRLRSNNPARQEENLLALTILLDSIVYYNVSIHGKEFEKARAPTPVVWDNIQLLGRYHFKRRWFQGFSRQGIE